MKTDSVTDIVKNLFENIFSKNKWSLPSTWINSENMSFGEVPEKVKETSVKVRLYHPSLVLHPDYGSSR